MLLTSEYIAAIRAGNRIVTGLHHGEAFEKLTETEKEVPIESGFFNPKTLKFISEDKELYLKEFIILRHGDAEAKIDSSITKLGRSQIEKAAAFLFFNFNIKEYQIFSSPYKRCRETAFFIGKQLNSQFTINCSLAKMASTETSINFVERIRELLDFLPAKNILISHADFIKTFTEITTKEKRNEEVLNCSITYINQCQVVWYAKDCEDFNCSM
jgi:broad specificity phosphatase PhoE